MAKCRFCDQQNPADAIACTACGAPLPEQDGLSEIVGSELTDLEARLLPLLQAGQKIEAIKAYRKERGGGLKEAKDAVEALAAEHGIAIRKAGCAGVLFLIATGAATAVLWRLL